MLSGIADAARNPRTVWRSERAYVVATVAAVVGLGNVWRFPYMAGQHGGGSFVLAYIVCILLVAVPLASLESAAGSLARRSPVGLFRRALGRPGALIGWAVMAVSVAVLSYYLVVTGWTLGYAVDALRGDVRAFAAFREGHTSLWLFLVAGAGVLLVLMRGVGAIERASRYVVPVLVLIVLGLAIHGQSLAGAGEARAFYLRAEAVHLLDPATWRAAAGQAFYSIGVGQGMLIAYGSFVPAGTNLLRSTTVIALINSAVSIVSGLLVFAVVFTFDISPSSGSELSFTAFPEAFAALPGGGVLAVAFFGLLFLAGFTSCLGIGTVLLAGVRDELRISPRMSATAVGAAVLIGVPSALSFTDVGLTVGGQPVLDRVDQWTGSGLIVVLGLVGAAVLARRLPTRSLTAAFGADTVRIGGVRIGPRLVLAWASLLPLVAAVGYAVALISQSTRSG